MYVAERDQAIDLISSAKVVPFYQESLETAVTAKTPHTSIPEFSYMPEGCKAVNSLVVFSWGKLLNPTKTPCLLVMRSRGCIRCVRTAEVAVVDLYISKHYKPVSNITHLSNVIEKVGPRFIEHFQDQDIFDTLQSAYRKLHSTETALVSVINDIRPAVQWTRKWEHWLHV